MYFELTEECYTLKSLTLGTACLWGGASRRETTSTTHAACRALALDNYTPTRGSRTHRKHTPRSCTPAREGDMKVVIVNVLLIRGLYFA